MNRNVEYVIKVSMFTVLMIIEMLFFLYKFIINYTLGFKNRIFSFTIWDLILYSALYFLLMILFVNIIKNAIKIQKMFLISICSACIIFNTVAIIEFYLDYASSRYNNVKWIEKPDERLHMVNDMFSKIGLLGMKRDQVLKNLGNPEEISKMSYMVSDLDVKIDSKDTLIYYIGPVNAAYDGRWLYIKFDNNETVINYKIFTFIT